MVNLFKVPMMGIDSAPTIKFSKANVSSLRLVWMHQYPSETPFETSPLIVDGFMFITVPPNRVEALDSKTGELVWSYDRKLPEHLSACCGLVNRGLAVLGNTLFLGTLDAHLVALDIKTGQVIWDVEIAGYRNGYSITSAPLAFKNLVVTGVAGGEFGARGFVSARDAATGKEIWRFDTIPQPGQPGAETWEKDALKTGGGPTWLTGTFDPDLNLSFCGRLATRARIIMAMHAAATIFIPIVWLLLMPTVAPSTGTFNSRRMTNSTGMRLKFLSRSIRRSAVSTSACSDRQIAMLSTTFSIVKRAISSPRGPLQSRHGLRKSMATDAR